MSVVGIVIAVLGAFAPDAGPAATDLRAVAASSGIDTSSRTAVASSYRDRFAPNLSVLPQWSGNTDSCTAGRPSTSYVNGTLDALNYVRALAHLGPVSLGRELTIGAQQAALIMSANGALSHTPPSSWRCWTSGGAHAASKSNLALAYPLPAAKAIRLYMSDPGSSNTAVGHRRWLLYPMSTVMGIGSTTNTSAIWAIGPTSSTRPNPAWVGWPTAGYFPTPLEPHGRWSLSAGSSQMSFGRAVVRVLHGTSSIRVYKFAVHDGYGMPTIVWQMPSGFERSGSYRVVVSHITRAGTTKEFQYAYTVRLFDPAT